MKFEYVAADGGKLDAQGWSVSFDGKQGFNFAPIHADGVVIALAVAHEGTDHNVLGAANMIVNACSSHAVLVEALTAATLALGRGGANMTSGPNRAEWLKARAALIQAGAL